MASVTMSTFVALPKVKLKQLVGTFEPSIELLNKLRGLLVPSPTTSQKVTSAKYSAHLPLQPNRRQSQSVCYDGGTDLVYPSSITRSEPRDIRAVKAHRSPRHSPKRTRTTRQVSHVLPRLVHDNVLDPWDILPGEREGYAITFTSSVTLESLIHSSSRIPSEDADSYFKQAILGLEYLHRSNVAHQDLRPENLIITVNNVLKISNFEKAHYSGPSSKSQQVPRRNSCSTPEYVAPEVFVNSSYDAQAVDMWAMGIIYIEMRRGKLLWIVAAEGADECYDRYLQERVSLWGYRPIENLNNEHCGRVITSLLDPAPAQRYTASRVLKSTWCSAIKPRIPNINETP
ncbi:kinase-like protein [Mollisia scopiformis]|uniref:Kinase-like protein n=1 Tax=Mollisia scopiformis TaxID=149040 RepID=A0A194XND3_MOLSC|nr:kinase-like protein [Mollisia scopiformis]KUJ21656.1 kinase-like protein [Mollisia scopiformis]